ncbi:oligosaccharide flippase family protein, partial [Klebsiella pneumoniae]|nr:oligosaccharide flippase family protein [Klebsiella pneumoniae]
FNKRKTLKNLASLGFMQIINYALPIILMPYLIIKIGISNVGLIATITAITAYIQLFIDYGFNLSATRDIAKNGYDDYKASIISSSVFAIKSMISVFFLFSSIVVFLIHSVPEEYKSVFFLTFGIAVFQSMFPSWHFQAAEKMHFITGCNSIPKLIFTGMIFIVVNTPNDVWKVQACLFAGAFVSFATAIVVLRTKFNFKLEISFKDINKQLKDGYSIFVARIASGLYKNFNVLILGFFAGTAAVGAYSIAERILRSAQMVQNVIGDTLYPSFAKGFTGDPGFFKKFSQKYKWHIIVTYTAASLILFYLSDFIGHVIGRTSSVEVASCLKIMAPAFLFGGLNYVCAILGMTSCGYSKQFSLCVIATGIFNVVCSTVLSYLYSYHGTSLALTLSELFLLCLVLLFSKRIGVL